VTVDLKEWTVSPAPLAFAAGAVRVTARNRGTEKHELVVVRAPIGQLPVVDGAVDEEALPAGAFVAEIGEFDAGGTCAATFDLSPGTYSFFCNVVETEADGTRQSHFGKGMVSAVTVG
jgi:plastocyanin